MHTFIWQTRTAFSKPAIQIQATVSSKKDWGYWHQRADDRHGNPSQGHQELLIVRDKDGRPPGELGVSKSMECDIFPPVL